MSTIAFRHTYICVGIWYKISLLLCFLVMPRHGDNAYGARLFPSTLHMLCCSWTSGTIPFELALLHSGIILPSQIKNLNAYVLNCSSWTSLPYASTVIVVFMHLCTYMMSRFHAYLVLTCCSAFVPTQCLHVVPLPCFLLTVSCIFMYLLCAQIVLKYLHTNFVDSVLHLGCL